MIDWPGVARGALWVLGVALALAAFSRASWSAAQDHVRLRSVLGAPAFTVPFATGLLLICTSLAWGAVRWWETGLWLVLALLWGFELYRSLRSAPAPSEAKADEGDTK